MTGNTTFFRLLSSPIASKGADLRQQVGTLNQGQSGEDVFQVDPANFFVIPGTPFAYWADNKIYKIFQSQMIFGEIDLHCHQGIISADDTRFLRLDWEVPGVRATSERDINSGRRWANFAKGGEYSKYFCDMYLLVNCQKNFAEIIENANKKYPYLKDNAKGILHADKGIFFRLGLTWPRRTNRFSVRILPTGSVFSDKGPAVFSQNDNQQELLSLMAVMNSKIFYELVKVQLARTELAQSYEVGIIQNTPIPIHLDKTSEELADLSSRAFALTRQLSLNDETKHVFCLPELVNTSESGLSEQIDSAAKIKSQRQFSLATLQNQINRRVAELYGVPELLEIEPTDLTESSETLLPQEGADEEDEKEAESQATPSLSPVAMVSDLLMWCVGVAFGRWDMRFALDPSRLPPLPEPFDPLPVCSLGMLVGSDGLPLTTSPEGYPLPIAWDGFLMDDPGHPRDIVTFVLKVLNLLWGDKADEIEQEACQILGATDLRTWLRDHKGFFTFHTHRYSKSRRKAPIYWLLQSARRNYGIWLYYPRLNPDSLFHAGREYADAKLNLETGRLEDVQRSLITTTGVARKEIESKIAAQSALVAELKAFLKALDSAALLGIKPDLNDGVLLNIAPLHELVPWKEAERAWQELLSGKYEWSSIGKQLRQKGLVKK